MRVVNEYPDVLVIEDSPLFTGAVILSVTAIFAWGLHENWGEMSWFLRLFMSAFVGLLVFFFVQLAINVTARFDRRLGRIVVTRRGIFSKGEQTYNLRDFVRARVEESSDSDGSTYRLVLVFSRGATPDRDTMLSKTDFSSLSPNEIPFTAHLSSGGGGPRRAAAAINTWARVTPA
jgi:hypothetical protein